MIILTCRLFFKQKRNKVKSLDEDKKLVLLGLKILVCLACIAFIIGIIHLRHILDKREDWKNDKDDN